MGLCTAAGQTNMRRRGPLPSAGTHRQRCNPRCITLAGLAVVDVGELADRLALPVLVVTRRNPVGSDLADALRSAGLEHRLALLERVPRAFGVGEGLYLAHAETSWAEAERLVHSCLAKSRLPEPLRMAHLIAQAVVLGKSRGRV